MPTFTSEPLDADLEVLGVAAVGSPGSRRAGRDGRRPAPGRRARRDAVPGRGRDPEPDPSRSHETPEPLEPGVVEGSGSRCARPATGSRPAIGSGSRSRPRCGRSSGRRRCPPIIGSITAAPDRARLSPADRCRPGAVPRCRRSRPARRASARSAADRARPTGLAGDRGRDRRLRDRRTTRVRRVRLPDGRALCTGERLEMTACDADPAHARMHQRGRVPPARGGPEILIEANGTIRTTATDFHMNVGLRVTLRRRPVLRAGLARDGPPPPRLKRAAPPSNSARPLTSMFRNGVHWMNRSHRRAPGCDRARPTGRPRRRSGRRRPRAADEDVQRDVVRSARSSVRGSSRGRTPQHRHVSHHGVHDADRERPNEGHRSLRHSPSAGGSSGELEGFSRPSVRKLSPPRVIV